MSTAAVVVVLVAGILAVQLAVWGSVLLWFRHRRRVIASLLNSELAAETIVRSPEPGSYRGASIANYPIVKNDGIVALTRRRLVFHTLTGKVIEVPVTDITGVREAAVFNTAAKAGREHLIIQTPSGEIGFYVRDNAGWITSLTAVCDRPMAVGAGADFEAELRVDVASTARERRASKRILAVVFTSIGLVLGAAAGVSTAVVANSISGNQHGEGTVVDLVHDGKGYDPVVEFTPPGGASVRFTGGLGSDPPAFRVGEHVEVRYNPDNPQDATIDQYWQIWFLPTLFGICSAPFLLLGIFFGVLTLATRRADTAMPDEPRAV